jgi:hypothetical protein
LFVTSSSPSRILPAVGSSKPAISRSTVVLPEPLGPSIEKNSPSAMSRSSSSTARTWSKCLLSPRTEMAGELAGEVAVAVIELLCSSSVAGL